MALIEVSSGASRPVTGDPAACAEPEIARHAAGARNVGHRFRAVCIDEGGHLGVERRRGSLASIQLDRHQREMVLNDLAVWERGQAPFAGTARRVLRTNGACPLFPKRLRVEFRKIDSPAGAGYTLHAAAWGDGSRAVLDSRGMLHLRGSQAAIPELTLVLCTAALGRLVRGRPMVRHPLFHRRTRAHAGRGDLRRSPQTICGRVVPRSARSARRGRPLPGAGWALDGGHRAVRRAWRAQEGRRSLSAARSPRPGPAGLPGGGGQISGPKRLPRRRPRAGSRAQRARRGAGSVRCRLALFGPGRGMFRGLLGLLARLGGHKAAAARIEQLRRQSLLPRQTQLLVDIFSQTATTYPDAAVAAAAADATRTLAGARLGRAGGEEQRRLLEAVRRLVPADRLLGRGTPAVSPAARSAGSTPGATCDGTSCGDAGRLAADPIEAHRLHRAIEAGAVASRRAGRERLLCGRLRGRDAGRGAGVLGRQARAAGRRAVGPIAAGPPADPAGPRPRGQQPLAVASAETCQVYRTEGRRIRLEADCPGSKVEPLAVLDTADPNQFAVFGADGAIRLYQMPHR